MGEDIKQCEFCKYRCIDNYGGFCTCEESPEYLKYVSETQEGCEQWMK